MTGQTVFHAGLLLLGTCGPLLAQGATHELRTPGLSLRLDGEGRVIEFVNRRTGNVYLAGGTKAPWRMFYRTADAIDLEIEPDGQQAEVSRSGNEVTVRYAHLTGQQAPRGTFRKLDVSLKLRASANDDTIEWTAEIQNRESGVEITEIWLPWLHGLQHLGKGHEADVLYWPESAGRRIFNPLSWLASQVGPQFRGNALSLRMTYPWPASMSWFTLNNGSEGLYVGSHDRSLMTSALNVMLHEGPRLSASVVKYPFVATGETWRSEPVITRVYQGDWHEAARFYRAWAETWMARPEPPEWVRRSPGWAHPSLGRKGQSGHVTGSYSDYPEMLRQARSLGMNTLINFGWVKQGFDNRYPEYDPDEALGGAEGLRRSLAEVRNQGGRTILYTQGQLIDPSTEFYRSKGRRITAKDVWGYEYREQYAFGGAGTFLHLMRNKYFGVACPSAPGWLDQLVSQYEMVRSFGAQGIIFDQMGGRPPYICFATDHMHRKPSLAAGPGKVANLRNLRERIKKDDPDFALVIELAADCYAGFADITHSHGTGFSPGPDSFGEMFRYTFPDVVITNRSAGLHDRQTEYGHAFSLGLRWDAGTRDVQEPTLGRYLARLSKIRNRYASLLLEGSFIDNEKFTSANRAVSAHAFAAQDRLAVVLWNPTSTPQRPQIDVPQHRLESVAWQDPKATGLDHVLMPNEVAVLVFRENN